MGEGVRTQNRYNESRREDGEIWLGRTLEKERLQAEKKMGVNGRELVATGRNRDGNWERSV